MNVLIVGTNGVLARNFTENLCLVRDGKIRSRAALRIEHIFEHDPAADPTRLEKCCNEADFVLDFSGTEDVQNEGTETALKKLLRKEGVVCPLLSLCTKENTNKYAEALFQHKKTTCAPVYLYPIPEVFGKWDYTAGQTTVSGLCQAAANGQGLPELTGTEEHELLCVDDLVEDLLDILEGEKLPIEPEGMVCLPTKTYRVTMGEVAELLASFAAQQEKQAMPEIPVGSFPNKLFSVYLSYLPKERICYPLDLRVTDGGEQFRVMTTEKTGQVTINRYRPGTTLGLHWHNTKWEQYMVISGHGLVRERRVGSDEVLEFDVSGEHIQVVQMIPGYVHSITNLSETEDLLILIWASELFNPKHPDTNTAEI